VEGEAIGLGHPFQPGVWAVQWPDGANHEGLLTLLWAGGNAVRHRATQEMRQGPPRFIGCGIRVLGGVEVQPGALGVLFQQALALEAAADALADGDDLGLTLQTNFVTKALVGLFGSDSFRLAVSADGSTFFDGLTVDNTNGIVDQPQLPRFKAWSNYDNYVGVGAWTKIGLNNTTCDTTPSPEYRLRPLSESR